MSYKDFEINNSEVFKEVKIIKPSMSWDERGSIYTSFNIDFYPDFLPEKLFFKHDKFAESKKNVLRGLHGDKKTWKLISCVWGEIYEVIVDMRPNSETFKKWQSFNLSGKDYSQVLVPPGFVNGYYVLSNNAVFHYKLAYTGKYFDANEQMVVKWNDCSINIQWPCKNPILQKRDN